MTPRLLLLLLFVALSDAGAADRDSVTIERNWRVMESQAAQDSAVEARKQMVGRRGFAAWYDSLNGGEEWVELSPEHGAASGVAARNREDTSSSNLLNDPERPRYGSADSSGSSRGISAEMAVVSQDSVTVTFTLTDAGAATNADVWVYPYDAEADTLVRAGGIEVQRQVGPAWLPASPVFTRCDSCAGVYKARLQSGFEYGAIAYHYRASLAPGFGEFVARVLPQLTDGWVQSSPVVPLTARFVAADSLVVTLRFMPMRWKVPCTVEPCQ